MKKVEIYGSRGYIGELLLSHLSRKQWNVVELQRNELPSGHGVVLDLSIPGKLNCPDVVDAYRRLIRKRVGVVRESNCKYIYAGSTSSIKPTSSVYGSVKEEIEALVKSGGGSVLRFGLIVDWQNPGGRFLALSEVLRRLPIVPIPDRSSFQIFLSSPTQVVSSLIKICEEPLASNDYIAYGTSESNLGELAQKWANIGGKRSHSLSTFSTGMLVYLLKTFPKYQLDPLKSLTIHRSIDHIPSI